MGCGLSVAAEGSDIETSSTVGGVLVMRSLS